MTGRCRCAEDMGGAKYDPDRRGYRIFVGNLAGATSHDDLASLFTPFGPIVDVWLARYPAGVLLSSFVHPPLLSLLLLVLLVSS